VFGKRLYIRNVILKYLDIPKDDAIAKPSCSCKACINPYHTAYTSKSKKNQKLGAGDDQLLLAFLGQGISVTQIAKALKVHRSTIYRKLKDERFCSRSPSN
jgi:transcriptional regulator of acetoin/glycerol metabolism